MAHPTRPSLPTLALAGAVWLWSGAATAASRLVVSVAEPMMILMDGASRVASGAPVIINHVQPGTHTIEFRSLEGHPLHVLQLDVQGDGEVRVDFAEGEPPRVVGAQLATGAPAPPPGDPGATDDAARASAPPDPGEATTFDTNEGTTGSQRPPAESRYAGNPEAVGRVVGAAARMGGAAVAPRVTGFAGVAAPAAVRTTANLVRNAEAGGPSAFRSAGRPRQGRPTPPAAKLGRITLISTTGDPTVVYVEGFVVAELGSAHSRQVVTLEEGRHTLDFHDTETGQRIHRGVVQIQEGSAVVVEFSDAQPPQGTQEAWSWSLRSP